MENMLMKLKAFAVLVLAAAMGLTALPVQAEVVKAIDMEHHFFHPAFIESLKTRTDYPYEVPEEAVDFVKKLPISAEDKEKILYKNAEKYIL